MILIVSQRGSDAWWQLDVADLLPESLRGEADKLRKGEDTMDVWFDSGAETAASAAGAPAETRSRASAGRVHVPSPRAVVSLTPPPPLHPSPHAQAAAGRACWARAARRG